MAENCFHAPRCDQPLEYLNTDYGKLCLCFSCFGHLGLKKKLAAILSPQYKLRFEESLAEKKKAGQLPCARCRKPMREIDIGAPENTLPVDICEPGWSGLTPENSKRRLLRPGRHKPARPTPQQRKERETRRERASKSRS